MPTTEKDNVQNGTTGGAATSGAANRLRGMRPRLSDAARELADVVPPTVQFVGFDADDVEFTGTVAGTFGDGSEDAIRETVAKTSAVAFSAKSRAQYIDPTTGKQKSAARMKGALRGALAVQCVAFDVFPVV